MCDVIAILAKYLLVSLEIKIDVYFCSESSRMNHSKYSRKKKKREKKTKKQRTRLSNLMNVGKRSARVFLSSISTKLTPTSTENETLLERLREKRSTYLYIYFWENKMEINFSVWSFGAARRGRFAIDSWLCCVVVGHITYIIIIRMVVCTWKMCEA